VLDRPVALKVFKPESASSLPTILSEARAAAALNHPNVCTIFAVDDSEGVPVIVMEYVDGQSLDAVLQSGPMIASEVVGLGRQIALGMAAAHSSGIVHGDLKPANLLVTHRGTVKITDFGLSRRALPSQDSDKTQDWIYATEGKIAGTPAYMSPEQSRGEPATAKSDVFSLGAVFYEMLTGQPPFAGKNVLQVLDEIRNVVPESYSTNVPDPFPDILSRSFVRDARDREITMDQIVEILR